MEQFVIDKIIQELQDNPSADPIAIVEANRVVTMDMIAHAWECAITKRCEDGRTNSPQDYFKAHFNIEI